MVTMAARLNVKEEIPKRMMDIFDFNLRVASPGIILTFDVVKQTATVQIAITERIKCNNETFIKKHGTNVGPETIPALLDVPVYMPRAGGFALTVPVKKGDECLVIFSDTCFDAWYQSGCPETPKDKDNPYQSQNQMSLRRHDLSDAIALLGIWSQPHKIIDYSEDTMQLRSEDGKTVIDVADGVISMSAGETPATVKVENGKVTISADSVLIGDSDAAYKLIDERLKILFDVHTHLGVTTGSGVTGVPVVPLVLASCSTSKVKGI